MDSFEENLAKIKSIGLAYPKNRVAKYFDKDYFNSLYASSQHHLMNILKTGIEYPESEVGVYVLNAADYDHFSPLLDPVIRDYHHYPKDISIVQWHNWESENWNMQNIASEVGESSVRIRCSRNVEGFPMPAGMTKKQRIDFENLMIAVVHQLTEQKDLEGDYYSLTPGSPYEMPEGIFQTLVNEHIMFQDMSADKYMQRSGIGKDWPTGRGVYISKNRDIIIWVNEEDHLRIISMGKGKETQDIFTKLKKTIDEVESLLTHSFSHSTRYGYASSCPSNLGTGMRASIHMKLPIITQNGRNLELIKQIGKGLGLDIRGEKGEHSEVNRDGIVDVSPQTRLGTTEKEVVEHLYQGIATLYAIENSKILQSEYKRKYKEHTLY